MLCSWSEIWALELKGGFRVYIGLGFRVYRVQGFGLIGFRV